MDKSKEMSSKQNNKQLASAALNNVVLSSFHNYKHKDFKTGQTTFDKLFLFLDLNQIVTQNSVFFTLKSFPSL